MSPISRLRRTNIMPCRKTGGSTNLGSHRLDRSNQLYSPSERDFNAPLAAIDLGGAYGAGIFTQGNAMRHFAPGAGQSITMGNDIAGQKGVAGAAGQTSLVMSGLGLLTLSAANQFSGRIVLNSGTLSLQAAGRSVSAVAQLLRFSSAPPLPPRLGPMMCSMSPAEACRWRCSSSPGRILPAKVLSPHPMVMAAPTSPL